MNLYPIIFEPILQERIWGGTKLETELGKENLPGENTGESWEISGVEGNISVVKNGSLKGKSLTALVEKYPTPILGAKVHERFGTQFPLLFKFLDARQDLSIQVHPNDKLAKERHNSFGKTEMWYVMQADAGSCIIAGFKEKSSPEQYLESLKNNKLVELLNQVETKQGDVFFLETGTIHALRGGTLVAEIQQTSDITYRVYDWERVDANGKARELHIDQAVEAINYNTTETDRQYRKEVNKSNAVVNCPYFTTNYLPLEGSAIIEKDISSFTVYICTEGEFEIMCNKEKFDFKKGDTVLIPASLRAFTLTGTATLLEIYIS